MSRHLTHRGQHAAGVAHVRRIGRAGVLAALGFGVAVTYAAPSAWAKEYPDVEFADPVSEAVINQTLVGDCLRVDTFNNTLGRHDCVSTENSWATDVVVSITHESNDCSVAALVANDTGRVLCTVPAAPPKIN